MLAWDKKMFLTCSQLNFRKLFFLFFDSKIESQYVRYGTHAFFGELQLKSILCVSSNAYCNSTIITTPVLFTSICTRCLEHSSLQNYWISVSPWIFNRDLLMKPFIIIYERMIPVSSCSFVCVSFYIHNTNTHTHTP